ncbi:MAG: hypothetical protein KDA84_00080 [Planctomycetaceae bacterium]|nr:hypothetical protein [Planctomycetaceae bacterium]
MAVDIDSPRDRTVCFMVSEEEREAIDEISLAIGRTRSAILTRIATGFVSAVYDGGAESESWSELRAFLADCERAISKSSKP